MWLRSTSSRASIPARSPGGLLEVLAALAGEARRLTAADRRAQTTPELPDLAARGSASPCSDATRRTLRWRNVSVNSNLLGKSGSRALTFGAVLGSLSRKCGIAVDSTTILRISKHHTPLGQQKIGSPDQQQQQQQRAGSVFTTLKCEKCENRFASKGQRSNLL